MTTTTAPDATAAAVATLELLDPFTLTVNTNVRTRVTLDPLFVESIREHGVLTPVVAHRDRHGQVVVDQGQRRTLAATEVGLGRIPVYVHPNEPEQGARIVDQLTENEHRAGLHQSELVAAVEQLSLIGYTPAQIAKRVSIPKETAAAAVKVATSKVATEHADTMTLEDAALLVEFDTDPDAVERLTREAGWGRGLAATAQRIRDDYAERDAIAAKRAELEAEGLTVVDRPGYDDKTTQPLSYLRTDAGKGISAAQHAKKCPGHVVWVGTEWNRTERVHVATPGCSGWKKHGHVSSYGDSSGAKVAAEDMSEEERETARLERRHVVESNKDWKAATTVRREWLLGFAQVKTAPASAEKLIASAIAEGWANLGSYSTAWPLTGMTVEQVTAELATATRGRALHVALLLCVVSWEHELAEDAWRSRDRDQRRAATVLHALAEWGYPLSAIEERLAAGTAHTPEATHA